MIHTHEEICEGCERKLEKVHPSLHVWFTWVKSKHKLIHIAWGFRDQANQDADFLSGKSKLNWPHSKHNAMKDGKPCSRALDLFELDLANKAHFQIETYHLISEETQEQNFPIIWGGSWADFPDLDHFELTEEVI